MKTLKLIVLMLLTANFVVAQTTYGTGAGAVGSSSVNNSYFGINAGKYTTTSSQGYNTFIGANAGRDNVNGQDNTAVGQNALFSGQGTSHNVAIGREAGSSLSSGDYNTFIGRSASKDASSGDYNVAIGYQALFENNANNNIAIGKSAGLNNQLGTNNTFIGESAGEYNDAGSSNMYLGRVAGRNNNGDGNTFLGSGAGNEFETGNYNVCLGSYASKNYAASDDSYKLYVHVQESSGAVDAKMPLLYGEFPHSGNQLAGKLAVNSGSFPVDENGNPYTFSVNGNTSTSGKMAVNTTDIPDEYTLAVKGKTITEEVQVMEHGDWPDYVFAEDYDLMPLTTLEAEIASLGHLPGVPSAEEVEENGHALGQMDAILLEKIEELTLHLIDMNKEMTELRETNKALETRLSEVEGK